MDYGCLVRHVGQYYPASWVQTIGSNEIWTRASVECTYNWAHSQRVYTNEYGDLVVSVLERRYLTRLREFQDGCIRLVHHLLVGSFRQLLPLPLQSSW